MELFGVLASSRRDMEHVDACLPLPIAEFETEALQFLPNVARYARLLTRDRPDADDLTQETFLRAYQRWSTFRPGSDCRKWLFTICRNIYLRQRQRSKRFVAEDDAEAELKVTRDLYMDVEDCSYAEAANTAGVPIGTIRSRLFRARRLLQQSLLEHARDLGLQVSDTNPSARKAVIS